MKFQWSQKEQNTDKSFSIQIGKKVEIILNRNVAVAGAASTVMSLIFPIFSATAAVTLSLPNTVQRAVVQTAQTSSPSSTRATYAQLESLLAAGQWRAADIETTQLLLQVAGREGYERALRVQDINQFSCEALSTIDRLWGAASNGNLGFSIQSQVYRSLGGTRDYDTEISEQASIELGWKRKDVSETYKYWMGVAREYEDRTGREFQSFPPGFPTSEREATQVSPISYEDRFSSPMNRGVLPTGIGIRSFEYGDNVWLNVMDLWIGRTNVNTPDVSPIGYATPEQISEYGSLGAFLVRVEDCGL